jgi:hypothetical protein
MPSTRRTDRRRSNVSLRPFTFPRKGRISVSSFVRAKSRSPARIVPSSFKPARRQAGPDSNVGNTGRILCKGGFFFREGSIWGACNAVFAVLRIPARRLLLKVKFASPVCRLRSQQVRRHARRSILPQHPARQLSQARQLANLPTCCLADPLTSTVGV